MQIENIQVLDSNIAGCRDMLHGVAKNESAEEVQRPQPGLGEEVGSPPPQSPHSISNGSISLLLPSCTPSPRTRGYFLGDSPTSMFGNISPFPDGRLPLK